MNLLRVGFTHGDINGIGLELLIKALSSPEMLEVCTPVIFSDKGAIHQTLSTLKLENPFNFEVINSAKNVISGRINVVNVCQNEVTINWGNQAEESLQAEAASLNTAIEAFHYGDIDTLICCPGQLDNNIDEHHLSDFIRQALGVQKNEFDWVINDQLRLLKLHPLNFSTELGEGMAIEAFMNDLTQISAQLRQDFGLMRPRIAVLSGNTKLAADIVELREHGVVVFGPFDAKEFVEAGNHTHYDAVLFLEEEETRHSLIASLNSEFTYGYVSGLPLVLAYSLQPVSYQIAGQDKADPMPLRQALFSSIDIFRNRMHYQHATHHPLEKQWIPKGRDDFKLDLTNED